MAQTPGHCVLLCPPSQGRILVVRAELGQPGIHITEATDVLPGIVESLLLLLRQDLPIRVIVIEVDQGATAGGHADH